MKKYSLNLFVLSGLILACLGSCDTEGSMDDPTQSYFIKYYGGDGDQHGVDIQVMSDGSFLLLGNYMESTFDSDVYLLRVDAKGNVIWELRYDGEQANAVWTAKDLEATNDGNYVVLAEYQPSIGATRDLALMKFSPEGELLKTLVVEHSPANEFGRSITLLADGRLIVSGTTEFTSTFQVVGHPEPDPGDFLNYRITPDLQIDPDWAPAAIGFGARYDVAVRAVEVPATGDYYVYGYTNSEIGGQNSTKRLGLFYFRRNSTGTTVESFYPGNLQTSSDTEINFVEVLGPQLGNGVVLVGTSTNNINVSGVFLARMRSTLTYSDQDIALSTIVPLNRNIKAVCVASAVANGAGYLVLGNEMRSTATNIWLSKVDQSGRVLWSTTLGSEEKSDFGAAVKELPDGKIAIVGSAGLADNQSKLALIKVNGQGQFQR